jgi:transposase
VGRFFQTDGKYLSRAYKEHLSGFDNWDQKDHADEWVLLEQNMGERLSIDETMLHHDLFTFLSNKDGHCKKGSLIAAVKGTTVADVTKHLDKIPEESRKMVKEVTMDFSDSMMGIVKKEFPQAEIVIDLFHVMQLYGKKGLDAMRMKLKRANTTEVKKQEREFKKRQEQNAKNRKRYKEKHPPRKSKNGKRIGRPPKRKNEKFEPPKLSNGETKADLLTHVRYPLMKSPDDWTDFQRQEMRLLFEIEPKMKVAYGLLCALRNIFSKAKDRKKARKALHKWYKNVGKTRIRELISVRDTIKSKEEYILNYFNNRSTNASAESFNSKIKGLRAQVHGVNDLPFFMFRIAKIFWLGGGGRCVDYPRRITPAPGKFMSSRSDSSTLAALCQKQFFWRPRLCMSRQPFF